jgi:hypothetical protein
MSRSRETGKPAAVRWPFLAALAVAIVAGVWHQSNSIAGWTRVGNGADAAYAPREPSKVRIEKDKQFLWAKGPVDPSAERSEWFDMTGSPLPLVQFEHGIGRDTIPSIDHPVFVKANDERLRAMWERRRSTVINDLPIIGFVHNGVARAYPVPLLNRHELVNDTVGGNPVTVGW